MMRYGSVCSGIEAATVAWHPLGFVPAWFSEIEKFPSAVLAHHYPHVPNRGDMTKFEEWPDDAIDLLVGGTPCQSFSVAGLRAGLADPRGNLMLTYLAIAAKYSPRWLVWENVPGVLSSNGGRDFGTFLRGLGELGYGFAYRVLDAQFCRASGIEYAVPQRRRRVFVVGYLGDWRRAAAVLFDGTSLRGDPAPRREAGQRVAADVAPSLTASGRGIERTGDTRGQDPVVAVQANSGDVGYCLTASAQNSLDAETETLIAQPIVMMERGRGDGPVLETRQDGTANAILTPNGGRGGLGVGAVAYDFFNITAPVNRQNRAPGDPCHTLARDNANQATLVEPVGDGWAVRRLTPLECERLQGFPDGYTQVPYRNKPAADGPRYKALGNSMAVNVMRIIGERIAMVDAIKERAAA